MTTSGPLIAGEVSLPEVMTRLQQDRPVFHSEWDLQHSFARVLRELAPKIQSRLEVRQNAPDATGAEYLDLLCIGPAARTAIEFKYRTAKWAGTAGPDQEQYALLGSFTELREQDLKVCDGLLTLDTSSGGPLVRSKVALWVSWLWSPSPVCPSR